MQLAESGEPNATALNENKRNGQQLLLVVAAVLSADAGGTSHEEASRAAGHEQGPGHTPESRAPDGAWTEV